MWRKLSVAAVAGFCLWQGGMALAAGAPATAVPDYHPSLGDLMTMAVQPRHIKVGLAVKARNWDYLAYEASELRNAFARIGRTIPVYRKQQLTDLFGAMATPQLDALDAAIKAKNGAKLDVAYRDVTLACNSCHAALDHASVVITAPGASPYADQAFTAH